MGALAPADPSLEPQVFERRNQRSGDVLVIESKLEVIGLGRGGEGTPCEVCAPQVGSASRVVAWRLASVEFDSDLASDQTVQAGGVGHIDDVIPLVPVRATSLEADDFAKAQSLKD